MKLVLSLWLAELSVVAIAINMIASCNPEPLTPRKQPAAPITVPKPKEIPHYPNVLDTMPSIYVSAMDELEEIVKKEVNEKEREFACKR